MLDFNQTLIHSQIDLQVSITRGIGLKFGEKKEKVAEKPLSTLSVNQGLKYKSRFLVETQNRSFSPYFDLLLTSAPK